MPSFLKRKTAVSADAKEVPQSPASSVAPDAKVPQSPASSVASTPPSTPVRNSSATTTTAATPAKKPGDTPTDQLVIEIVSCWDLPAEDLLSSDPYVKVKLAGHQKYLHETKHIPSSLNPIWDVKTGNLFTVPKKDVQRAGKVIFKVKEYDRVSIKNETLGSVEVDADTLLNATGERMEYDLTRLKQGLPGVGGKTLQQKGRIVIRCREATLYDVRFVQELMKGADSADLQAFSSADSKLMKTSGGTGVTNVGKMVKRNTKTDRHTQEKLYRIRPHPDPDRPLEQTKWMTHDAIIKEALGESQNWLDIGSGDLGRIYLEIIGIDDMVNMDELPAGVSGAPLLKSNKTDSFVAVVYEDTFAKTDVIDDCLSPRWMPWMQRAFVLRTMFPNSQLFLGVFDYDSGSEHDLVGRVSVDLTNLRPGSEYLLYYNLYKSAKVGSRKPKGTLIIRLRIETDDERQNIIRNLSLPPSIYINTRSISDFRVAKKTIEGKTDVQEYSQKTLNGYIDELRSYKYMLHHLEDAAVNLLFWRGTFSIKITKSVSFLIPLHSISCFLTGTMLVERPSLLPAFWMFAIGWLLMAVQNYRFKSPNPWDQCRSYNELLQMLINGVNLMPPPEIAPHQNEKEALEYEEKWNKRIAEAEEELARRNEEMLKQQAEFEQHVNAVGSAAADTDISSKDQARIPGGSAVRVVTNLNPMKLILYPLQIYLGLAVEWLRFVKNIVIWEECYLSFIVATASFVLGFVFLFVPWAFLMRWTARLLVWGIFGPWMKLVDKYWYSKLEGLSEEEKKAKMESMLKVRKEQAEVLAKAARIQEEEAVKMKAIKTLIFGDFLTKVPTRNTDRHRDLPLPPSSAVPEGKVTRAKSRDIPTVQRVGGQHIENDMVPRLSSPLKEAKKEAEKPKAVEKKVTTASKKRTARIIFFLVILPLLVTVGWFAAPHVSSRLPDMPVLLVVKNGVVSVKDRIFRAKAETEAVLEEEAAKMKASVKKTKDKVQQKAKESKKALDDAIDDGDGGGGYLTEAQNLISSWFGQIASLFGQ